MGKKQERAKISGLQLGRFDWLVRHKPCFGPANISIEVMTPYEGCSGLQDKDQSFYLHILAKHPNKIWCSLNCGLIGMCFVCERYEFNHKATV